LGPSSSSTAIDQPSNDFWQYLEATWSDEQPTSDLDNYLKESIFRNRDPGPFDVLKWWKVNTIRYPILSKLARDVLCIPISTVASESAFSAGGRILDDYRSSLKESVVENLVCESDWIRANTRAELQTLQVSYSCFNVNLGLFWIIRI
jgi:hAT family C-terminal dimerisation region